jgi:hypothetical protein
LSWFYQNIMNPEKGEALAQVKRGHVAKLPIAQGSKSQQDRMIELVDVMLTLHERLLAAKSTAQKEVIQRQIDAVDAQIDSLVYKLYGLSRDEIRIVEELK